MLNSRNVEREEPNYSSETCVVMQGYPAGSKKSKKKIALNKF